MRKLSKREQVLIYIAVMMAILSGGYSLLIEPALTIRSVAYAELENTEMGKAGRMKGENLPLLLEEWEEGISFYENHREDYSGILSPAQLERKVLTVLNQYGLEPNFTAVKAASPLELPDGKNKSETPSLAYTSTIQIQAVCSWREFHDFLDGIKTEHDLVVISYLLNDKAELENKEDTETSQEDKLIVAELEVICYMADSRLPGEMPIEQERQK